MAGVVGGGVLRAVDVDDAGAGVDAVAGGAVACGGAGAAVCWLEPPRLARLTMASATAIAARATARPARASARRRGFGATSRRSTALPHSRHHSWSWASRAWQWGQRSSWSRAGEVVLTGARGCRPERPGLPPAPAGGRRPRCPWRSRRPTAERAATRSPAVGRRRLVASSTPARVARGRAPPAPSQPRTPPGLAGILRRSCAEASREEARSRAVSGRRWSRPKGPMRLVGGGTRLRGLGDGRRAEEGSVLRSARSLGSGRPAWAVTSVRAAVEPGGRAAAEPGGRAAGWRRRPAERQVSRPI